MYFVYLISGATKLPMEKPELEKISYEAVDLLTTLIIPAFTYNVDSVKSLFVVLIIVFLVGIVYVKTNYVYKNLTLILFNFSIHKVVSPKGIWKYGDILITNRDICNETHICYNKLDEGIYFIRGASQ